MFFVLETRISLFTLEFTLTQLMDFVRDIKDYYSFVCV